MSQTAWPPRGGESIAVTEGWEQEAENWVRWTRTPGHDAYWHYREPFFAHIVPAAGRRTLEIGCGEGRVARDLAQRGHAVTAVDASPTLLRYAQEADPAGRYLVADAAALPFPDEDFDRIFVDVETQACHDARDACSAASFS